MGACRKEMTLGGEAFYAYGSLVARGGGGGVVEGFGRGSFLCRPDPSCTKIPYSQCHEI